MAEELEDTKGSKEAWDEYDLSDPDLDEASVIGAALGGVGGQPAVEDPDLMDMGRTIYGGISTVQPPRVQERLKRVRDRCADR